MWSATARGRSSVANASVRARQMLRDLPPVSEGCGAPGPVPSLAELRAECAALTSDHTRFIERLATLADTAPGEDRRAGGLGSRVELVVRVATSRLGLDAGVLEGLAALPSDWASRAAAAGHKPGSGPRRVRPAAPSPTQRLHAVLCGAAARALAVEHRGDASRGRASAADLQYLGGCLADAAELCGLMRAAMDAEAAAQPVWRYAAM